MKEIKAGINLSTIILTFHNLSVKNSVVILTDLREGIFDRIKYP